MLEVYPCCPRCHSEYVPGTELCSSCGAILESAVPFDATKDPLPLLETHGPKPSTQKVFVLEASEEVIYRSKSTRRIVIESDVTVIGRRDPASGEYPDIDLSQVANFGFTARRHAELRRSDDVLQLVDLKGQNTTAITNIENTIPLATPTPVQDGERFIIGEAVTFLVTSEFRY